HLPLIWTELSELSTMSSAANVGTAEKVAPSSASAETREARSRQSMVEKMPSGQSNYQSRTKSGLGTLRSAHFRVLGGIVKMDTCGNPRRTRIADHRGQSRALVARGDGVPGPRPDLRPAAGPTYARPALDPAGCGARHAGWRAGHPLAR